MQQHVEEAHDRSRQPPSGTTSELAGGTARCYICGLVFENAEALGRHDRWAHPEAGAPVPAGPPGH